MIDSSKDHERTTRMALNDGLASTEESLEDSMLEDYFGASTSINYNAILRNLCSKIEGTSYFSGSSSTWFLRGALAKYEEQNNTLDSSGKVSFSPRGLTDLLLENLLLEDHSDDLLRKKEQIQKQDETKEEQDAAQQYENYLIVAKALAKDSLKYLPAMAASLSNIISSTSNPAILELTTSTSRWSREFGKRRRIVIPQEFLQLWIASLVHDSTPKILYEQLREDLFRVFQLQCKLRNSDDPLALPSYALICLIEGDFWHCKLETSQSKSISPPPTQATLRRALVLLRFLSRSELGASLDSDTKQKIACDSGAMKWLMEVLGSEDCPIRHQKQRRETSSELLDILLDECKMANKKQTSHITSVEWLFSTDFAETVLLFFKQTIRELVEEWNQHLVALPVLQEDSFTTNLPPGILPSRTNRDLVSEENRKALVCATRYIKFIARLPPKVCPLSSRAIVREASEGCDKNGKDLLAEMMCCHAPPFQRLRLIQLLIDEFANCGLQVSADAENDDIHIASLKLWLSSPGILTPILDECSKDPFLASSDATDRFVDTYGDPSWKARFAKKSSLREAPKAISVEAFKASGQAISQKSATTAASPKIFDPISRLLSESLSASKGGKLLNKIGDRLFGNPTLQGEQYNLFGDENHAVGKSALKEPQESYNLLDL